MNADKIADPVAIGVSVLKENLAKLCFIFEDRDWKVQLVPIDMNVRIQISTGLRTCKGKFKV